MGGRYDDDNGPRPSPAALFRAFAGGGGARPRVHGGFRLLAAPGQPLGEPLRAGDVLIRRIAEDGYVHVAFIAADGVLPVAQALERGWRVESPRPGGYAVVVEAGARPHRRADAFARRLLDPFGRMPPGQLVVRRVDTHAGASGESAWAEDAPRRKFLILSGGPGLYDEVDTQHDAGWSSYVDSVLLKSVRVNAGKKKIIPFWASDEQVVWLVYTPAYVARWKDDEAARRTGVASVKKAGFNSYVQLLEARAKERGWTFTGITRADELWAAIRGMPPGSISRLWFYGHARNDLWLTLEHDTSHRAVEPAQSAVVSASAVAANAALRDRFEAAPPTRDADRTHRFVGCNTAAYARAWATAYGQWTEGFVGTVQFKHVHTSSDHEPSRTTGCTLQRYRPTGVQAGAGEAWEDAGPAPAWGGWSGGARAWTPGQPEAWQPEADEAAVATLQWTEWPEDAKTPQADAEALHGELRPLFQARFSTRPPKGPRITLGARVGTKVDIATVAPADWKQALEDEGTRLAKQLEPRVLDFAPEIVARKLVEFYRVLGQPFPAGRLGVIDRNTRLTADERSVVFSLARAMTIAGAQADADRVDGFYSRTTSRIYLKSDGVTAGSVAHEMAHAYADGAWDDFIDMMRLRRMKDADKLNEGMTVLLAGLVVKEWFKKQPAGATVPGTGYDSSYTDRAREFIGAVGETAAYEAYFAGQIDFDLKKPPEDSLVIGKAKKPFKWLWR